MPISAENRERYPKNWQDIRAAILERAESRCEFCGVPNGALIIRGHGAEAGTFIMATSGAIYDAQTGALLGYAQRSEYAGRQLTRVILTTAHLDHMPEHNDPANLRALCCRCHLLWDAQHHRQSAYHHRRANKAWGDLFDAG
jgi:5-methylcytosine-specific restriction endonuclease McrA